jgi:hypothetical protein
MSKNPTISIKPKITLKDFGMLPTTIIKKNKNEKIIEFRTNVNKMVETYLNDDDDYEVDKKEIERIGKILNSLSSYGDRLEKMYPKKIKDNTESGSGSD